MPSSAILMPVAAMPTPAPGRDCAPSTAPKSKWAMTRTPIARPAIAAMMVARRMG